MGIYLGNTKITGTGVQIDNTLSSDSTHAVTNAAITSALVDVGYNDWVKPADWIDIRNCALDNSVYYLVSHSAPTESGGTYTVADYPKFSLLCTLSTSANTYDVYVDGVKVATTAHNTETTLDWGTLYTAGTVQTLYTTTHPTDLVYHIVRVTPSVSTDTFTRARIYQISGQQQQGLLWAHYQFSNPITLASGFGAESAVRNYLLEAVTAKNDTITYRVSSSLSGSGIYCAFTHTQSLKHIPTLVAEATTYRSGTYNAFTNSGLKKLVIKNNSGLEDFEFLHDSNFENVDIENPISFQARNTNATSVRNADKLKNLPAISTTEKGTVFNGYDLPALEDTFLDLSFNDTLTLFKLYGTEAGKMSGLKGLIVSPSAPFDGESPQINISYTGLNRAALVALFNSLPSVTASQVCNITGATGANDLTAEDLAIATAKGWTITR